MKKAIHDIKQGKIVIVIDDEDRENEGDFVAAELVTPEMINFMATHGRGLILAPLIEERCDDLGLELMIGKNSAYETPFTVSVDLIGNGCTTGISTHDRSKTIQHLLMRIQILRTSVNQHIFPLKARKGGVLRRAGHTEAAIDLARLAGLKPAGVIVEILNEDGSMARTPELFKLSKKFDLKFITIKDLIEYRMRNESLINEEVEVNLPTEIGDFKLKAIDKQLTNKFI